MNHVQFKVKLKMEKSYTFGFVKKLMIIQYFYFMSILKVPEVISYSQRQGENCTYLDSVHCFRFSVFKNK